MNKTLLLFLMLIFTTNAIAENEGVYNATTGTLHLPAVVVFGDTSGETYSVDMQIHGGFNFSVTNIEMSSNSPVDGDWQIMPMGCSSLHAPYDEATMTMYAETTCQTWSQSYLGEYSCMEYQGIQLWHALCK